jgi:hypothetical protein
LDEYLRSYHMFDTIGAIGGTAAYALLGAVLVGLSQLSGTAKFAAFATAIATGFLLPRTTATERNTRHAPPIAA